MITVDWFVNEAGFEDIHYACGEENKNNEILGAHIIDNPDTFRFFKKGELAITTGYVFQQMKVDDVCQIIKAMHEHKCSGFVLKINRYYNKVPQIIIDEANKYGLPILSMPYKYALSEVQTCVLRALFASEMDSQNKKIDMLSELTNKILIEDDIESVALFIGNYLKCSVVLANKEGEIIAGNEASFEFANMLELRSIWNRFENGEHICTVTRKNGKDRQNWLIWKIESRNDIIGYFIILEDNNKANIKYVEDIEHIIPLLSMVFIKLAIKKSALLKGDIFNYILDENVDKDTLKYACSYFHFDTNHKWCIVVFDNTRDKQKINLLEQVCSEADVYIHVGKNENYIIGALGFDINQEEIEIIGISKKVAENVSKRIEKYTTEDKVCYGIGGYSDFNGIKNSYHQAVRSIIFNSVLKGSKMVTYQEQKVYHFLYENVGKKQLEEFYSAVILPLEKIDKEKHMDLLETLQTLVMNGWSSKESAEQLFIHRNTLIFRKDKIFELLGLIDTPYNKTYLEIAVYGYTVVKSIYDSANAQ
jgi:Purine catabolism regulatory protein-like family.